MGRSARVTQTKRSHEPTCKLKIGRVKKISFKNVSIESFCGKQWVLTEKYLKEPVEPGDIVQIIDNGPRYLFNTIIVKLKNNIFGTASITKNDMVEILIDMLDESKRILLISKEEYEKHLSFVRFQRIRINTNEKGELIIKPV